MSSAFEKMLLIRRVEERLLELFSRGELNGTTHTSLGQEACAVGVMAALDLDRDFVVSNHRCHGHFLAYGGPLEGLFGEVMGKAIGVCRGIGGSQHLHWRRFYSNGVLGGTAPFAVGLALAEKLRRTGAIGVVFLGDGAMSEGVVYEALNMASLWSAPLVFVVEANGVAQATPIELELAGSLPARAAAFGIDVHEVQATSPQVVTDAASNLVAQARTRSRPGFLVLRTYRLGPHSKGDDLRPKEDVERARASDPLNRWLGALDGATRATLEGQVRAVVDAAVEAARAASPLTPAEFEHHLKVTRAAP